ncbi:MAG: alpha-N-arabinofuranosidase [Hyphomonadaceae bacterium]|nr:alpha-N-arabinofuranosidase [Hyphomonadaceae bacterium]
MMRTMIAGLALALSVWLGASPHAAAQSPAADVQVTIRADRPGPVINPNVYAQFAEHLGAGIYEGVWVGEGSSIPNTHGFRNDVVAALRDLKVPLVRWPGGCFADDYHWREGIGPRDRRPVRVNAHWGRVPETNAFGTHEFMAFAEMIGAKVYISGNVGSGSVQEMGDWLEYLTSDTQSALANERRANGRAAPWTIDYFGVGNETWGCGGNMRPEFYADLFRQYATYIKLRTPPERRPKIVASGGNDEHTEWVDVLASRGGHDLDAISHHYYTTPSGVWEHKGNALGFSEGEWISSLVHTMRIDDYLTSNERVLDRHDPQGRIGLYLDEWGMWYSPTPGREPGFLWQQNSLRDAVVAGLNFNIFHRHAKRVQMTNIAQMVNVLQAMILTDGPRMILTPTYHAFHLYRPFQGATYLPTETRAPRYRLGAYQAPAVSVSAARDTEGRIQLALVNLDPNREALVRTRITGAAASSAVGRVLTASAMDAHNSFDAPNAIQPTAFSGVVEGDALVFRLPAKSVAVVALQ